MFFLIYLILGFCIILLFIYHAVRLNRLNKMIRNIPGPKPIFPFGNALDLKSSKDILNVMCKFIDEFGTTIKFYVGIEPNLITADYKFIEYILTNTNENEKGDLYRFLHRWLGTGLLTSDGEKWWKHRKILTPAFHFEILKEFIQIFDYNTNLLIEKLKKVVDKDIDIFPYISLCALDNIIETAMGTSVNAQTDSDSIYVKNVMEISKLITARSMSPIKIYDTLYFFTIQYWKEKKVLKVIHSFTNSVIKKRKQNRILKNNKDGDGKRKRKVFLDILLDANNENTLLSDDDIREEVDTFMFEGHDTTTAAMSFMIYCLATNPDVQMKALEEQKEIFQDDSKRALTHQDLQNMKYLEMVAKETMRLYPSVPIIIRKFKEDKHYNGTNIPTGLNIIILLYKIMRDPNYFPDPDKFDPERFSSLNEVGRPPFSYIPFSGGPRNCIGQKFAMLEIKATISKLLRNYEIQPVPGYKPDLFLDLIYKAKNGILVRLKKRE